MPSPLPIPLTSRFAFEDDASGIQSLLLEAAAWLNDRNVPIWHPDELSLASIAGDVQDRLFPFAQFEDQIVAAVKYQNEDRQFWPDISQEDSAFLHRLVVSRQFAGKGISTILMKWAVDRGRHERKRYLMWDCEIFRPKLRRMYESFGFRHHSDRQVGRFHIARYEYDLQVNDSDRRA